MAASIRAKSIIAIFVAGAVVAVAPAAASVQEPVTPGDYSAQAPANEAGAAGDERTSAGPQHPALTRPDGVVTIRDGSRAVPFVADVLPDNAAAGESTPAGDGSAAGDGFDWGDAAIGAGAGLLAACFAMLGSAAISDRRGRASQPTRAVSQRA